jgi:hypothetical protein
VPGGTSATLENGKISVYFSPHGGWIEQVVAALRRAQKSALQLPPAHRSLRRFLCVQLGHAPLIYILAPTHPVGEVDFPTITTINVGERCSDPPFGHNGVRFAEKTFTNHPDRNAGGRRFNGRAQSRAAGADDKNVVLECLVVGHVIR